MEDQFITIATYNDSYEANLMRSKLLSMNVECILADENVVNVQPFYSNAVGGIKLKVREQDEAMALEILEEKNQPPEGPTLSSNGKAKLDTEAEAVLVCPNCGSTNIYFERFNAMTLMWSILLLGFPLLFLKGKWKCFNCGESWKNN